MAENYMRDQNIRQYYDFWIKGPTPLEHSLDRERFYKFVKACVSYAGGEDVQKKISPSYLRLHLYDDLHNIYSEKAYDEITHQIIVLFESLLEYEDANN